MKKNNIPVGISDFEKIRKENYCYIDKSGLIKELLEHNPAEVMLITRPRRFGKTLAMSMLASFFDIRKDSSDLFKGLEISKEKSLCEKWMNRYPTLFLSLKRVDGLTFSSAYEMLCSVIEELCVEHEYLLENSKITDYDKQSLKRILERKATETEIKNSLQLLTRMMRIYYGKPVILLIDEYDVPVAKANMHGYYKEMLDLMKGIMQALKDNSALGFAVITGCLKIAKESIFTGTNNFISDTITSCGLNEYFGFTQDDVEQLLKLTDTLESADEIKKWYDGYHFGEADVYCPWDVMNYLRDLQMNPLAKPESYWKNTSDNGIIRSFIDYAGQNITKKLETLLSGGFIFEKIDENLTYDYLHSSEENLWSVLYLTGYLTRVRETELSEPLSDGMFALTIPNAEIKEIFETTVIKWFQDSAKIWNRKALFDAVWSGNSSEVTKEMSRLLRKTISYHDYREDFYHAFLAGIFTGAGYTVESNKEHGEGRSDIVVYDLAEGRVAIFEAKYAKSVSEMEKDCDRALNQIEQQMYAKDYEEEYDEILCYGISFFKKRCLVKK